MVSCKSEKSRDRYYLRAVMGFLLPCAAKNARVILSGTHLADSFGLSMNNSSVLTAGHAASLRHGRPETDLLYEGHVGAGNRPNEALNALYLV
jgi:hypothetical protein